MSDTSRCNRCTLESIKYHAREDKKKVVVVQNTKWGMSGLNVYVVPTHFERDDVLKWKEDSKEHKKYFVAWFMELPDHCAC